MASAFSHAFVALALGRASRHHALPWRVLLLGVLCSILPDMDVAGLYLGIPYGDLWGHRGLTHSWLFAGLLSAALIGLWHRQDPAGTRAALFLYFFLCTASHGVLDAMTDGGLGVAFFSPFDTTRYFFPIRPIAVSPIGIGEFFSTDALRIFASEALWIWLPTSALFVMLRALQRFRPGLPAGEQPRVD
jgi:inner membrane protein